MPNRPVDVSKLTGFEAPGVFRRIDPALEAALQHYPETLERLEGVVYFCACMGRQAESEASDPDSADRRRSMRAALAEYASLDEAATIDTRARSVAAPKVLALDDPRLHVVRLLRHSNIHLAVSKVEQTSRGASWNDQEFVFRIYYSPDIGLSIQGTDQAQKYHRGDLAKMIEWIESEQMEWGLDHLICRTAELYAHSLVKACGA